MNEQLPPPATDEPLGDIGDQAARLQMQEEQAAIRAALAGDVHGTDALEGRSPVVEVLEGPDTLDVEGSDASDDPVHGGGLALTDDDDATMAADDSAYVDVALTDEEGAAVAVDEGGTVTDDGPALRFEDDGDPDVLDDDLAPLDASTATDDLVDLLDRTHDPDDPMDPDGYGVPPAPDGGDAVVDETDRR